MKKLIYVFVLLISICTYSKAQFNVMDSATLINVPYFGMAYTMASTPANAPAGPDYSNLITTKHPKWFRWTVCGSDLSNYFLHNQLYSSNDTTSIAIWGPFKDTVGISNKLDAAHLNKFYNTTSIFGIYDFYLPKSDSLGIYIMLICNSDFIGSKTLVFDNSSTHPLHYDNRCGICAAGFVNYEQPICTVSYDTAYKTYSVYWDKQNNYRIASFNVSRYNTTVGNVPVTTPGYFLDQTLDSISNNLNYQLIAVDSSGNSATNLNYIAGAPYCNGVNINTNSSYLLFYLKISPLPTSKVKVFRGTSESNMILIDSVTPSGGIYVEQHPPQGLCYYSFIYNNVAGCHPDSLSTLHEVRTNTAIIQHICMVAVDTVQQKNVVVWDKQDNNQIDHFNIYREGSVTNQFDSIGTVAENAPALYVDMAVNPNTKLYKYLVRPVLANGNIPQNFNTGSHTTMHMQASPGLFGEVNLSWNAYAGFDYATFYLYRGTSPSTMQVIDSIASNSFSYTDYTPPSGLNFYRVTVRNPYGCHPDSSSVVYESRSNSAYAVVTAVADLQAQQLKLFPNPAKDFTLLDYGLLPAISHFDLINSVGKVVGSFDGNAQHKININTTSYNKGVYYIVAKTNKGLLRKKLVIL